MDVLLKIATKEQAAQVKQELSKGFGDNFPVVLGNSISELNLAKRVHPSLSLDEIAQKLHDRDQHLFSADITALARQRQQLIALALYYVTNPQEWLTSKAALYLYDNRGLPADYLIPAGEFRAMGREERQALMVMMSLYNYRIAYKVIDKANYVYIWNKHFEEHGQSINDAADAAKRK